MSEINDLIKKKLSACPKEVCNLAMKALELADTYSDVDTVVEQLHAELRKILSQGYKKHDLK